MNNVKERKLSVRFTEDEIEKIRLYAARYGLTVSAFIRFSAMAAVDQAYIPQKLLLKVLHRVLISKAVQRDKKLLAFLEEVRKKCTPF